MQIFFLVYNIIYLLKVHSRFQRFDTIYISEKYVDVTNDDKVIATCNFLISFSSLLRKSMSIRLYIF